MLTRGTTKVLCRSSGKVMDDKNQPVMLPNGYCYSESEIKRATDDKRNKISDPWGLMNSGSKNIATFKAGESRKIYFC